MSLHTLEPPHDRRCPDDAGTLTEHSELTLSPLVHALLVHLIDGDGEGPHAELAAIREAHRRLLKEQLAVGRPVDAERAGHGA